jgi:hypothetical protein
METTRMNESQVVKEEAVKLSSLAEMTGFPEEFIKNELLLDGEEIQMDDLRKTMLSYLDSTIK